MIAEQILAEKKYTPNYAIRYKVGGNPLIVGEDGIVWSVTDKYFKPVETSLAKKYGDWEAMLPTDAHYVLVAAANAGQGYVEFMGREIMVMTAKAGTLLEPSVLERNAQVPVTRSPVTPAALKSAGQVAEALGKAIEGYLPIDRRKADAALEQLIWIAKNVSWESKYNRHIFESRWSDEQNRMSEQSGTSTREPESGESPSGSGTDRSL